MGNPEEKNKKNDNLPPPQADTNSENGSVAENPEEKRDMSVSELDSLKAKVAGLEKMISEAEDKNLRLYADFDNFRKRGYRDLADARNASKVDTMTPFLSVYDHFQLAVKASDEKDSYEALHQGMEIILGEFKRAFDDLGIEAFDASGDFDPTIHEAVSQEPSDNIKAGKIIRQWRCGYRLGEKLIRPCMVVVSAGPRPEAKQSEGDAESGGGDI